MGRCTSVLALPASILVSLLLFSLPSLTAAETDNGDECSCFRTNGSSKGYFLNHQFHDYRNIAGASSAPALITNATIATNALATSSFFGQQAWTSEWAIQSWNNSDDIATSGASVLMVNTPNNVYIEQGKDDSADYDSYLVLRTARHEAFQSVSEIDSQEKDFQHLSARFMARVIGSPGACAGIFTYLAGNDPSSVQEADIEILTRDPRNRIQYTNQPSVDKAGNDVPQATVNGTNPGDRDWTLWNVYRVDWMPKMTSWYVNGESVANITFQTPKDPAGLIVNMWSDGGVWTGNMSLFDEAFLQIQWIEIAYNTSGPYAGLGRKKREEKSAWGVLEKRKGTPGCKVVCSIDEQINVTGTPALLYNNTGMAARGWRGEETAALGWLPILLAGAAGFGYL
ncbi:putative endo-1,3(4)-beta-glucanase [Diplocarpon rosae]|nr:putative endo-1,3(4)-beta-glucanase [Diplocarpon rosae]